MAKNTRQHPNGDHEIVVLRKDYTKSGKSAKRFALYAELAKKGPVTVNAYIAACQRLGDDKGAADIRWDSDAKRKGGALIKLVAPKQQQTTTTKAA